MSTVLWGTSLPKVELEVYDEQLQEWTVEDTVDFASFPDAEILQYKINLKPENWRDIKLESGQIQREFQGYRGIFTLQIRIVKEPLNFMLALKDIFNHVGENKRIKFYPHPGHMNPDSFICYVDSSFNPNYPSAGDGEIWIGHIIEVTFKTKDLLDSIPEHVS